MTLDAGFTGRRGFIFVLALLYLVVLATIAVLYFMNIIDVRSRVATVPIGVLWFGAVGGVLISLTGVFEHYADWLPSYRYWHIARPLVGSAVAVVAVLIISGRRPCRRRGHEPTTGETTGGPGTQDILYYVIAFLVGFKEAAFRELLQRVGEVIIRPGDSRPVVLTITGVERKRLTGRCLTIEELVSLR